MNDFNKTRTLYIELLNNKKTNSQLKMRDNIKTKEWFFSFDSLPKNWLEVNIMDVTWLVTCGVAKKPDYVDEGIPFLSAQNARPFKANLDKIKYISQAQFKTLTVGGKPEKNDILYTRVGNCGEAAKVHFDFDFAIYVSLTLIKPIHQLIDSDYFVAFLNSHYGLAQANVGAIGSGLQNLNVNNVRKYKIPLPPLPEQKRIVAKLDSLFKRLEKVKAKMERVPELMKRFRESSIYKYLEGEKLELGKVLSDIKYGTSKKSITTPHGITILRIPNIGDKGELVTSDLKYALLDKKEYETLKLEIGDILIIRSNGSVSLVGKAAIVRENEVGYSYAGYLIRLRTIPTKLNPEYLNIVLKSLAVRAQIEETARSTSGVNNINTTEIKGLIIPLPSLSKQNQIAQKINSLLAKADKIEAQYEVLKAKLEGLPQAILAKAFKGELVEQLETDGDARELLEEIKKLQGVAKGKR